MSTLDSSRLSIGQVGTLHHPIKKGVTVTVDFFEINCRRTGFKAYAYACGLMEDKDGSAKAYGSNRPGDELQKNLVPREKYLENATSPTGHNFKGGEFRWVGVVSATKRYAQANGLKIDDRSQYCGKGHSKIADVKKGLQKSDFPSLSMDLEDAKLGSYPVVQKDGDTKGYYVSQNNAIAKDVEVWDQSRYTDPFEAPFAVRNKSLFKKGVRVNDVGWAINLATGRNSSFYFGDTNSSDHVQEVSAELFSALKGGTSLFIIFPGSGPGEGKDADGARIMAPKLQDIEGIVRSQLAKLRGVPNRADLIEFVLSGAKPDTFRAFKAEAGKLGRGSKSRTRAKGHLLAPLMHMGFAGTVWDAAALYGSNAG